MRWKGLVRFLVIGFGVLAFSVLAQSEISFLTGLTQTQEYKAWLEIKANNSHLEIKAYCRNNSSENSVLRYNLRAWKRGETGRTVSFQSGSVYLQSQSEKCLSQLGLRVSLKDEYGIKLEVYKNGKLVAEDSAFYPRGVWI